MGQYLRSCFRLSTLLLRVSQDTSLMRTKASSSCMTESPEELRQPDGICAEMPLCAASACTHSLILCCRPEIALLGCSLTQEQPDPMSRTIIASNCSAGKAGKRGAHQLADDLHKGLEVGRGHAIDLLHKLQRIQRVAVRGRSVVPARNKYPAALWQRTCLLHCPMGRLHSAMANFRTAGTKLRSKPHLHGRLQM